MQNNCDKLHKWVNTLRIFTFPFDNREIPLNGIYILFENGELAHGTNRIVRIGTHTGQHQLRSRLKQHFLMENKDRSIFRKNIGRCLLNKEDDPFLRLWNLDLTTRLAREMHASKIDFEKQKKIEQEITNYMQNNFSFVVLHIDDKDSRLKFESRIISTVSLCNICGPSTKWLGQYSPKVKIRECGLWLEKELRKQPLSDENFIKLQGYTKVH